MFILKDNFSDMERGMNTNTNIDMDMDNVNRLAAKKT